MFYEILPILLIPVLGSVSLLGARRYRKTKDLTFVMIRYAILVMVSEIIAAKPCVVYLGKFFVVPAAVVLRATTYMLTDIVNESAGLGRTYEMIRMTFAAVLLTEVALRLTIFFVPLEGRPYEEAYDAIFGLSPRIAVASRIAFLVSEHFDARNYHFFRSRGYPLRVRNAFGSILSLTVDTIIFIPLSFYGVFPNHVIAQLIVGQILMKRLTALIDTPFMYASRKIMSF